MKTMMTFSLTGLLFGICNLAFAQAEHRLLVGDSWTYSVSSQRDGRSTFSEVVRTVVALDGVKSTFEVVARSAGSETRSGESRDENLNIVESGNLKYIPHLNLFQFPLVEGKRSFDIQRQQIDSGRMIRMAGEVDVRPLMKVATPIGDFEAHEVISSGRFIDLKSGASSRYETRAWYAPAAKFIVKQKFFERNIADTADFSVLTYELKAMKLVGR